jgi:hypothetical protein
LLQGIISIAISQQKQRDRELNALDVCVQITTYVVDHHVHVRAGEAADELRERERSQKPAGRGARRIDSSDITFSCVLLVSLGGASFFSGFIRQYIRRVGRPSSIYACLSIIVTRVLQSQDFSDKACT